MTVELTKYYYILNIMEVSEEPNKHGSIISAKVCCSGRESSDKKTVLTYQLYNTREIAGRLCIMDSETLLITLQSLR